MCVTSQTGQGGLNQNKRSFDIMSITKTEQQSLKNPLKKVSEIDLSLHSFTNAEVDLMRLLESFMKLQHDLEFLELRFKDLRQQITNVILR
jgi:hypothetical protein